MELTELKARIVEAFRGSEDDLAAVLRIVDEDKSIFPFNEYEHLICNLINRGGLSYAQYIEIRNEYVSENPNLWIYENVRATRVWRGICSNICAEQKQEID